MTCRELFHDTIYHTLDWNEHMHLANYCYDNPDESWNWVDEICYPTVNSGKCCYSYGDDYGDGWNFTASCEVVDSGLYSRKFVRTVMLYLNRQGLRGNIAYTILQYLGIVDSNLQVIPAFLLRSITIR